MLDPHFAGSYEFQGELGARYSFEKIRLGYPSSDMLISSVPIEGFDWKFLFHKLASFLENKMATLGLSAFTSSECGDQDSLRIRYQRIR